MIQHLVAAALLLSQSSTGPAEPGRPCITQEEAADMAVSLLPFLLDGAAQRCRPHLAPGAFLLTGAADWSERLRRESGPRRASAMRGISKFAGGDVTPPAGAGGDAAFEFLAQLVTASVTGDLRPENCPQVDAIAQSLSPLPTENIARLVAAAASLAVSRNPEEGEAEASGGENEEEEGGGPPICRA